jgi:hypothetical protein
MTTKTKTKTKEQEQGLVERDLSKRPDLPETFSKRVKDMVQDAKNRVFFSFNEEDTAAVELLSRDVIQTTNGPQPAWTARYLSGNIHATGGGSPHQKGNVFRFWEHTVLGNKIREMNLEKGDHCVIVGLGKPEGKTYYDFIVEPLIFDDKEQEALPGSLD